MDKYKRSLQLLDYLSQQKGHVMRQTIISEPASGLGYFEKHFNITLSLKEKNILALILVDLQEKGLIEALFKDIFNSGNDLVITDKGRKALKKRVLDELDELLLSLKSDSELVSMRYGAYDAILDKQAHWQSQAANSLVELINHTLRTIAPSNKVTSQNWFTPEKNSKSGITRKHRIRFFLEKKTGNRTKATEKVVNKAWELIESCRSKLEGIKHTTDDQNEVEQLIKLVEDALMFLLQR